MSRTEVVPAPRSLRRLPPRARRRGSVVALAFATLVACLVLARPASAGDHIIAAGREESIKTLFGDVWGGKAGVWRLTGARIDASRVVVSFAAGGRHAELVLLHPDDLEANATTDSAFVLADRGKGLAITGVCAQSCSGEDVAALRETAAAVLGRFAGGLFLTPDVPRPPVRAGGSRWVSARLASEIFLVPVALLAPLVVLRAWRRRRRLPPHALPDMALVFAMTTAAPLVLSEAAPSNWYLDFLPRDGNGRGFGDQLGSAGLVLEGVARALLPWTNRALFGLTLAIGAAGAALAFATLRAVALPRATCLLALTLSAVSPLPARALWSGSVHAMVFALYYALLLSWLAGQRRGAWPERALALLLVPTLALVRVDALVFAATPFVWGLGRRVRPRRFALAGLFALVCGAAAWMTWQLVVLPSGAPVPSAADRWLVAEGLFARLEIVGQFMVGPASRWFPWPVAWLLVPGGFVLLVRRPGLLAKILVTVALPQIALARLVDGEGLIGCRYFLPVFPLLALVAAAPLGPLLWARRSRGARRLTLAAATSACVATVVVAWPMYRYRYSFQEEYRFLRAQLAAAPRPARVFHVAVHDDPAFRNDPDCCLDPGKSPVVLGLPGVEFEPLEASPGAGRIPDADEPGVYYYESAICGWGPTEHTESRNPGASARVRARCAELATDPRLTLVASTTVPARAAWPFFPDPDVRLRLFRVAAPDGQAPSSSPPAAVDPSSPPARD